MPKPIQAVTKRKRGRPATGQNPMIGGRVRQETIDAMDEWAKANGLTRSEAMGLLLEAGLKRPPKVGTSQKGQRPKT
jgi:hypothetical protein